MSITVPGTVLSIPCLPRCIQATSTRERDGEAETGKCLAVAVTVEPEVIQKECVWFHPGWVELTLPLLFPCRAYSLG